MDDVILICYDPEKDVFILKQLYPFGFKDQVLYIPIGYEFNASIPRNIWPYIGPNDLALVPVMVHDYLYEHKGFVISYDLDSHVEIPITYTREDADNEFLKRMIAAKVSFIKRNVAYAAVRMLGWIYWNR